MEKIFERYKKLAEEFVKEPHRFVAFTLGIALFSYLAGMTAGIIAMYYS